MTQEVMWARLTAREHREIAKKDPVVLVPVASIEQHGPHLPTGTDTMIGTEVCVTAAKIMRERGPVLVTPTIWTGLSPHHMEFGGTLTLDNATFFAVIRCICDSIRFHGIRRIALVNAHGGNTTALQVCSNELSQEWRMPVVAIDYPELIRFDVWDEVLDNPSQLEHAGEAETSFIMHFEPDLVATDHLKGAMGPDFPELSSFVGTAPYRWRSFATRTTSGVLGNAEKSTPEKGERQLSAASQRLADILLTEELWDLPVWRNDAP